MKTNQLIALRSLFALICFLTLSVQTQAQAGKDAKPFFKAAVLQINCATIRFIHNEAGRKDVSSKLSCLSPESVFASIPEDEANSTGKVAHEIDKFGDKFKSSDKLSEKIDEVITFASKKIKSKKRKGDVEKLTSEFAKIKKDAMLDFDQNAVSVADQQEGPQSSMRVISPDNNSPAAETAITPQQEENPIEIVQEPAPAKSGTDWVGYLALALGIISLLLAGFTLFRLKNFLNDQAATPQSDLKSAGGAGLTDTASNIRLTENKLRTDISRLREQLEQRMSALEAVHQDNNRHSDFQHTDIRITPTTSQTMASEVPSSQISATSQQQVMPEDAPEPISGHQIGVIGNVGESDDAYAKEENNDPIFRYTSLAINGAYFTDSQLHNEPQADSVFEIQSIPEMSHHASYSLLNISKLITQALKEPQIYLDPYFEYSDSPEGKTRIILKVDGEGILSHEDDRWVIVSRGKIKFE